MRKVFSSQRLENVEEVANLLRAEGLDTLPKQLAERVWGGGHAA